MTAAQIRPEPPPARVPLGATALCCTIAAAPARLGAPKPSTPIGNGNVPQLPGGNQQTPNLPQRPGGNQQTPTTPTTPTTP